MADPRSIRTNNPGAMNYGPFAQRHGAIGTDGRLAVFPDRETGFKAMGGLLDTYRDKHGLESISGIVGRWAPRGVDNNSTDNYIRTVSQRLGVDPNMPVPPDKRSALMEAMASYEAGRPVTMGGASAQPQPIAGGGAPMTPTSPMTPFDGMMPADVQKHRKLAQMLAGQATDASPVGHWTQALARVVQGGVGGMHDRAATEGERAGQASIAEMMGGNPTPQAMMANPYTQDMGKQLWLAQAKSKIRGPEADPSNVREWQHFSKLSPEDQARYLNMKRPDKWLDTGMELLRPNPAAPGGPPMQSIPKAPEEKAIATKTGENIAKTRAEMPETKQRFTLLEQSLDRLDSAANDVLNDPGLDRIVGGLYQGKAPNLTPGAVTAQTKLDTLKTMISGTVLQTMRDMSKTGGAVGAVTEREWPRLENMLANLYQTQDLQSFKKQANSIREYTKQVKGAAREAYEADVRTAVSGPQSRGQPARQPSAQAVDYLRTQPTPDNRQYFDMRYGPGAADAVLGGR